MKKIITLTIKNTPDLDQKLIFKGCAPVQGVGAFITGKLVNLVFIVDTAQPFFSCDAWVNTPESKTPVQGAVLGFVGSTVITSNCFI